MNQSHGHLLEVVDLTVHFPVRRGLRRRSVVHALDGVSITVPRGSTVGVVGESGSGKTTLGRAILRRVDPIAGTIWFDGTNLTDLAGESLRRFRVRMQSIPQDPHGSLNPRHRILSANAEPLVAHNLVTNDSEATERVAELLAWVGLSPDAMHDFPSSFSGGQLQRVVIARALAVNPELVIADEAVSALDVSIQAQVINLMQDLQDRMGVAYLFISHDVSVVRHIADTVVVMYAGKVVESGNCETVLSHPVHPYTEALIASVPGTDSGRRGRVTILNGEPPDPTDPPSGCRFRTRCPHAQEICTEVEPLLVEKSQGHFSACWLR